MIPSQPHRIRRAWARHQLGQRPFKSLYQLMPLGRGQRGDLRIG
jgi:hypothetical protein